MAQRTHPQPEATYRVIPIDDGAFAVEVSIPERHPAKVSPFATKADAEAWIADHRRVQSEHEPSRGFAGPVAVGVTVEVDREKGRNRSAGPGLLNPPRCALTSSEHCFVC